MAHNLISGDFFMIAAQNWETRHLIVGYEKEFLSSINSIENLLTSIAYIDRHPSMFEAFNTIVNGAASPQINRLHIINIDPPTMCNFIRFIVHSIFSTLQDNSFLLEYAKQIIPENRHPGEFWYIFHEDSPS